MEEATREDGPASRELEYLGQLLYPVYGPSVPSHVGASRYPISYQACASAPTPPRCPTCQSLCLVVKARSGGQCTIQARQAAAIAAESRRVDQAPHRRPGPYGTRMARVFGLTCCWADPCRAWCAAINLTSTTCFFLKSSGDGMAVPGGERIVRPDESTEHISPPAIPPGQGAAVRSGHELEPPPSLYEEGRCRCLPLTGLSSLCMA